jgi:hypothetical protein
MNAAPTASTISAVMSLEPGRAALAAGRNRHV